LKGVKSNNNKDNINTLIDFIPSELECYEERELLEIEVMKVFF
jgi:hypothetical protein